MLGLAEADGGFDGEFPKVIEAIGNGTSNEVKYDQRQLPPLFPTMHNKNSSLFASILEITLLSIQPF